MKNILNIILLFCFCQVFATDQMPDKVIYKGKEYTLAFDIFPMEDYFEKFPEKHPREIILKESPSKTIKFPSSGLWRGYIATYEIIGDELCLSDIEVRKENSDDYESIIHKIFPSGEKLKIDWLDGLFLLEGDYKEYNPQIHHHIYENYIHFEIKQARITKIKEFDLKGFEEYEKKQHNIFKLTSQYKEFLEYAEEIYYSQESYIKRRYKDLESLSYDYTKKYAVEYATEILD